MLKVLLQLKKIKNVFHRFPLHYIDTLRLYNLVYDCTLFYGQQHNLNTQQVNVLAVVNTFCANNDFLIHKHMRSYCIAY